MPFRASCLFQHRYRCDWHVLRQVLMPFRASCLFQRSYARPLVGGTFSFNALSGVLSISTELSKRPKSTETRFNALSGVLSISTPRTRWAIYRDGTGEINPFAPSSPHQRLALTSKASLCPHFRNAASASSFLRCIPPYIDPLRGQSAQCGPETALLRCERRPGFWPMLRRSQGRDDGGSLAQVGQGVNFLSICLT